MHIRFFLIVFILSQGIYAQHKKSYIFFETNQPIEVKFFAQMQSKNDEVKPIERNLFSFNNQNVFFVEVNNKWIKIDLRKYETDQFFNIKLDLNVESKGTVYKYKRGDEIRIEDNCKDEKCDIVVIEFPKIISSENQYHTTINTVFSKYIFDSLF